MRALTLLALGVGLLIGPVSAHAQAPPLWLDSPPSAANAAPVCPDAGKWLLLYWGGAPGTIVNAAFTCANDDILWGQQGGRWLGYSRTSPAASDDWTIQTGEALFVHGLTAPQPTAWKRDPQTGKWSFPGFVWDPSVNRWVLSLPSVAPGQ